MLQGLMGSTFLEKGVDVGNDKGKRGGSRLEAEKEKARRTVLGKLLTLGPASSTGPRAVPICNGTIVTRAQQR